MYQYVDRGCDAGGGLGCVGDSGGQTACRYCYLGSNTFPGSLGYPVCPMCVCDAFEKTGCTQCSGFYSSFKLTVTATRGGSDSCYGGLMQFADLALMKADGNRIEIDYATSSNPGGDNPDGEGPLGGTDGNLNVKFLDKNFQKNGKTELIFGTKSGKERLSTYQFWTANDCPARDPTAWTLYGGVLLNGKTVWSVISTKTASPPTARKTTFGTPIDPCVQNVNVEA